MLYESRMFYFLVYFCCPIVLQHYQCILQICGRFDMAKSSASDSFMRVVKALNDIAGNVIVWPRDDRRIAVQEIFHCIGKLPHVIGAIDGTNIPIKAPKVLVYKWK